MIGEPSPYGGRGGVNGTGVYYPMVSGSVVCGTGGGWGLTTGNITNPDRYYRPPPRRAKKVYSPYNKCVFCGTRSKLENMHGNCVACGAPLPDREFTYEED